MTIANAAGRFLHATKWITLLSIVSLCAATAFAQQNLVYINGNITATGQNAVIALVNDGAGNLSPLSASPFLTGGTGVGPATNPMVDAQWDSDGEVMINPEGTLLFAVNGHSNNISSFKINADGSLTAVKGSPFNSGGTQPASIAYKDNALGNGTSMMVVVNKDSDPLQTPTNPNYVTFQVGAGGVLHLNNGSSYTITAGASPSMALWRRGAGEGFIGVEFMAGTISSYTLNRSGIMSNVNSLTLPSPSPAGVGAVMNPNVKGLYLTLPPDHAVGVYSYDSTGKLNFVSTANNAGLAVCWAALNAAGTRLYTAETASGTISVYDITNSKAPVQLQHIAVSGTGALPDHMKVDPTGKFLYVLDRLGVLHVFDIQTDGTVAENHTPYSLGLPAGTVPLGVSVLMK
jgi:6-phosphogluconolactonase (cycloisomerase 2 family)